MGDYVFYGFVAVLVMIVYSLLGIHKTLISIDKKLSDPDSYDKTIDLKDELVEIKQVLEGIRYTTDIIENYKLPSYDDRKIIDRMRADQEIDEMIRSKRN